MRIRFAAPSLRSLDREEGGTLVICAFDDERPLRGVAGRVDWRLCGKLSAMLLDGALGSRFGDALLMPIGARLPFSRLMFVALGSRDEFDNEHYGEACHIIAWKLARMGETDFAMTLPARVGREVGLRDAVWGWRRGLIRSFDSAGLHALNVCIVADRASATDLHAPFVAIAEEVNDALRREAEERAIANAPPMPHGQVQRGTQPVVEQPRAMIPAPDSPVRSGGRRGWPTGVMKIGPATATDGQPASRETDRH